MNKAIVITACLLLVLFKSAFAQDQLKIAEDSDSKKDTQICTIKALDGNDQKVHVMPDYFNRLLKISCLKDTITIFDYWGVPAEVTVLNKNFIKISYAVRGGSDISLSNVMVLCINGGRLYEAMHVLEHVSSESEGEKELYRNIYKITMTLSGDDKKNYKLHVGIHDSVKSRATPAINYNYNNQTVLSFDAGRNVFYSIKEDIYDSFAVYPTTQKNYKEKLKGNYPVIILGKETYYYIKGGWYNLGRNNELSGFTTHTAR
ncbi:hypothetical protein SAMN05216490_4666 [Mucilaginibacter mallensis]|uniref:Uncharacterized protein n=1 Tax=Mucilaginibacter mallensis TaxID=652787 RepID=A0A1H2C6R6_MUCMA|nr:hypothetical protein [Mucilaginibacter mallensis]SDT65937.1 hypothetical protein SAMN05216490_4666 [Mucilaginibacter mallensis]